MKPRHQERQKILETLTNFAQSFNILTLNILQNYLFCEKGIHEMSEPEADVKETGMTGEEATEDLKRANDEATNADKNGGENTDSAATAGQASIEPESGEGAASSNKKKRFKRIPDMFDVTNMTYEQYVEKHYEILLSIWYQSQGFPPAP